MTSWLTQALTPKVADPVIEVAGRTLPLAIKRHPTAKKLVMRLAPDGSEVRVTMPRWGQSREAVRFAQSRMAWLERQLGNVETAEPVGHGATLPYRGTMLDIVWDETARRMPVLDDGQLIIGGAQESIPQRLEKWLRADALPLMESDLAQYCAAAGVDTPPVKLSRAQRRWGSCSSAGTVRINWRLIMAPDFVRRSVVAHEVAHLVHFDHSPAFHALLDDLFEEPIGPANRWLKQDGRSLYGYFG